MKRCPKVCGDRFPSYRQPSPRGEGAPKGRIGHRRYEREREGASQVDNLRKHPIHRWRGPPSPMGKATIRESPLLKKVAHHPCEPIRSPSTVIPSEAEGSLLHCRHMHTCALTQTTPWCFLFRLSLAHDLPLCKKDPSTSVGMTFKGNG